MAIKALDAIGGEDQSDSFEKLFDKRISIDMKLPGGIQSLTWGSSNSTEYRIYSIGVPGTMSLKTKAAIRKKYEDAGWEVLEVNNSEDFGEPSGLARISFKIRES